MKQFTCLPPEFHIFELLEHLFFSAEDKRIAKFPGTLASLLEKGWILYNSDIDSYKMHRIIATVTTEKLTVKTEDINALIEKVSQILDIDQTKDNPVDKFKWIPFGETVLQRFPDEAIAIISVLQNNLALRLKDLGDYQGAKTLLEKAKDSAEKNFGQEHPSTARSYSNLALVLQDLGDYEEALPLAQKALAIFIKVLPEGHPYIEQMEGNLAGIERTMRK